jgi:hypothetical protein
LLTLISLCLAGFAFVPGAYAKTALINASTVSGGASSVEAQIATSQGYVVTVVSDAAWGAMTAAQFGSYDLLIAGDPFCSGLPPGLVASAPVFGPVVLGTAGGRPLAGNRVLVGTDPVLHGGTLSSARGEIIRDGIAFAGKQPGRTGFYFDATCAGPIGQSAQILAILNSISSGAGAWTINPLPPCGGNVSLIAFEPSFATLTTADLAGWSCSVHESFPTFPTDWSALAVATDTATKPTCGVDPNTGLSACGQAYILIAGSSIIVVSGSISITPLDATNPVGTSHTVTAHVTSGGAPLPGQVVTFTVTGQNAGAVGTCAPAGCVTDANGDVSFTYTDANGAGDDTIKASFTDATGSLQSATAQKHWIGCSASYDLSVEVGYANGGTGTSGKYTAGPDSGFVIIKNNGLQPFVGELSLDGIAGVGVASDVHDTSGASYTLAPGASFRLEAGPESSNQGGFNKACGGPDNGLLLSIIGTSAGLSVNYQVFDKDIHSGTFAVNPFSVNLDNYILQGGDPFGRDTGDGFEIPQAHAKFEVAGSCKDPCGLACPGDITVCNDSGLCSAVVNYAGPILSGGCSGVTITCSPASGSTFPVGTTPVKCTATDASGAIVATCTFNVTVNDTEKPKITCPKDVTVECNTSIDPSVTGTATATDNCGSPKVSYVDSVGLGTCPNTKLISRTWTATDSAGNSASCVQTITVVDTTPPTIGGQGANATIECPAIPVFTAPTAKDNCDPKPQVIVVSDVTTPGCGGTYSRTITWVAQDCTGNKSGTVSQTITVVDTTPPTITCPGNITHNTDPGVCSAKLNPGTATATDTCSGATVVGVRSDGAALNAPYPKGVTTITWTATDACGNHSSCPQTITVLDKEPPTVTCSVGTSTLWPPEHDLINVGLAARATDNCDGSGLPVTVLVFSDEDELAPASGNFSPDAKNLGVGTLRLRSERRGDADGRVYLIVTKSTDSSGNTGFCSSTVTVTHDQSAASIASVAAQAAAAQAYASSHNGAPPPGYFVIGNGPIVGPKQ